jgi:hypothetical protein
VVVVVVSVKHVCENRLDVRVLLCHGNRDGGSTGRHRDLMEGRKTIRVNKNHMLRKTVGNVQRMNGCRRSSLKCGRSKGRNGSASMESCTMYSLPRRQVLPISNSNESVSFLMELNGVRKMLKWELRSLFVFRGLVVKNCHRLGNRRTSSGNVGKNLDMFRVCNDNSAFGTG